MKAAIASVLISLVKALPGCYNAAPAELVNKALYVCARSNCDDEGHDLTLGNAGGGFKALRFSPPFVLSGGIR